MKVKLIALLAAIATTGFSMSSFETRAVNAPKLGFQAGMTFNNISAPSDVSVNNKAGLAAGINLELPVTDYFSIQPELLFVQRKAEFARTGSTTISVKYESLEIPVFAKLTLNHVVSPYLIAGPVAYFNISKGVEAAGPAGTSSINFSQKTFDFGVAFGGGVDVGPLFVNARYTLGVTSIDENSADYKSRGIHVLAGLRI